jgi:tetratricopeptide (TPR) repeat protein
VATKAKVKSKATKKASSRSSASAKSLLLKAKRAKRAIRSASRNGSKAARKEAVKPAARRTSSPARVESRRSVAASASAERVRSSHYASAVQAYEAGIKLMHGEQFEKAIRCFEALIAEHAEEPEIQDRAKVLIHACEKKIQEKARTVLRSADDHYNVGIADLNRRELGSAIEHLQHALKLMPKGDHILYALATANALQGNRDRAIQHLKDSIQYRAENRFLAARDGDFESLQDDPEFKQLVIPSEK